LQTPATRPGFLFVRRPSSRIPINQRSRITNEPRARRLVVGQFEYGIREGKLWEMDDLVEVIEAWELANKQPEYNFVVRKYDIGKGYSVSVLWRGGEIDTIYGFETEHDALGWIREKSQRWLRDNNARQLENAPNR
jgi:hypothetical protein